MERSKEDQEELRRNTEENVGKMKESYTELISKVGELFALMAGGMEMKEFFKTTEEGEIATLRLSDMIGMSVEKLGQWQGALVVSGGTVGEFNQSMTALGGKLVDIEKNLPRAQRALVAFNKAGINLKIGDKADALGVLEQIQKKAKDMNLMEGRELGRRMGLGPDFMRMLHDADGGLQDLLKTVEDIGVPTREQAEAMEQLERSQKKLSLTQTALGRILVEMVAPAVKYVTDKLVELAAWANKHPEIIKAAFIGVAAAITIMGAAAAIAMIPILGISGTLLGVALAMGAIASGLYLLWQDSDSWLHDIVDWVQGVGRWFESVWARIGDYVGITIKAIWENIENIAAVVVDVLALVLSLFTGDADRIAKAWDKMCGDVNKMLKLFWNTLVFEASFALYSIEFALEGLWERAKVSAEKWFGWMSTKFSGLTGFLQMINLLGGRLPNAGPKAEPVTTPERRAEGPAALPLGSSRAARRSGIEEIEMHQKFLQDKEATERTTRVVRNEHEEALRPRPSLASVEGLQQLSKIPMQAAKQSEPALSPVAAMPEKRQQQANHLAAVANLPPEVKPAPKLQVFSDGSEAMDPTGKTAQDFNKQFSLMGQAPHAAMAAPAPAPAVSSTVDNSKHELSVSVGQIVTQATDAKGIVDDLHKEVKSSGLVDQADRSFQ